MDPVRPSLGVNLVAGSLGSAATVIVAVAAMPLYLRFLGQEAFGVMGFFTTLQSAVIALDGGLAIAVTSLIARAPVGDKPTADLINGVATRAWLIAGLVVLVLAAAAPFFSYSWLRLGALDPTATTQALLLAAIVIGVRWPIALYQGVLVGRQRVVGMNALAVCVTLASAMGGVALVAWRPDLRLVMGWLVVTGLTHVLGMRALARRELTPGAAPAPGAVRAFFRQAADAAWLGVVGLVLMQVDKGVLSKVQPVDQFGFYVLASLMAGSLYSLVTPVFNVVYPRLAILAGESRDLLETFYRDSTVALAAFLVPIAMAMGAFGDSILLLWTHNAQAAEAGGPVVALLAAATAVHGIMFVPYALKLACGATRLALTISTVALAVSIPLTVFSALQWGSRGAAGAWLALNIAYLVTGSIITHRRLMPGLEGVWLIRDVAPVVLLTAAAAWTADALVPAAQHTAALRVVAATITVVACWAAAAASSTRLRRLVTGLMPGNSGN